jgi:hypothetical protein
VNGFRVAIYHSLFTNHKLSPAWGIVASTAATAITATTSTAAATAAITTTAAATTITTAAAATAATITTIFAWSGFVNG